MEESHEEPQNKIEEPNCLMAGALIPVFIFEYLSMLTLKCVLAVFAMWLMVCVILPAYLIVRPLMLIVFKIDLSMHPKVDKQHSENKWWRNFISR